MTHEGEIAGLAAAVVCALGFAILMAMHALVIAKGSGEGKIGRGLLIAGCAVLGASFGFASGIRLDITINPGLIGSIVAFAGSFAGLGAAITANIDAKKLHRGVIVAVYAVCGAFIGYFVGGVFL